MSSNSFQDLVNVIRSKSALISDRVDDREDLGVLFMKSLRETVVEIQNGANSEEFADLTVINLIILGDKEGYSAEEMREFIKDLKSDDDSEEDTEGIF